MKGAETVGALAVGTALGAIVEGGYAMLSVGVAATAVAALLLLRQKPRLEYYLIPLLLVGFCRGQSWQILGSGDGLQDLAFIRNAHEALNAAISKVGFSDTTTPLVRAMISGDKSGITNDLKNSFRLSGASHLLALSGLHLGIIYAIISKSLSILGGHPIAVKSRSSITILICGFYAVCTGATPSIMRAFLFIFLRETARMTGRDASPLTTFSTALMIHLIFSPGSVLMPGFQLSYLAMCGIYFLFPHIASIYPEGRFDPLKKIWDIAALSISCQVFTAPAAWYHFRSFPQWFLLTNLIAMPLSSMFMLSAIAAICLSSISARLCPQLLISAVDFLAATLTSALSVIASM